ncbi:hypothetical protein EG327_008018 [Venturia inaequalis]|uniref:Uncharacterized protein n=1 Tax=Venturia inaequalis TaxID=5025 RepID=A0A8H3UST4_VENIN|nr:hypothetical protein EG327_008018 [Venturia inaequalis]
MPSEKLLRFDPCSPRGPFVDHIPSISRLFGGIRILQGMISVGMLGISVAVLVVRDGDGLLVNAMVLAGWPLVHLGANETRGCLTLLFLLSHDFTVGILTRWYNRLVFLAIEIGLVVWWNATWILLLIRGLNTKSSARFISNLIRGATIVAAVHGVSFILTLIVYATVTNQMYKAGAPYTHWTPWRDELENPIRRPVLTRIFPSHPVENARPTLPTTSTPIARV